MMRGIALAGRRTRHHMNIRGLEGSRRGQPLLVLRSGSAGQPKGLLHHLSGAGKGKVSSPPIPAHGVAGGSLPGCRWCGASTIAAVDARFVGSES
jgi:hypothetical protein